MKIFILCLSLLTIRGLCKIDEPCTVQPNQKGRSKPLTGTYQKRGECIKSGRAAFSASELTASLSLSDNKDSSDEDKSLQCCVEISCGGNGKCRNNVEGNPCTKGSYLPNLNRARNLCPASTSNDNVQCCSKNIDRNTHSGLRVKRRISPRQSDFDLSDADADYSEMITGEGGGDSADTLQGSGATKIASSDTGGGAPSVGDAGAAALMGTQPAAAPITPPAPITPVVDTALATNPSTIGTTASPIGNIPTFDATGSQFVNNGIFSASGTGSTANTVAPPVVNTAAITPATPPASNNAGTPPASNFDPNIFNKPVMTAFQDPSITPASNRQLNPNPIVTAPSFNGNPISVGPDGRASFGANIGGTSLSVTPNVPVMGFIRGGGSFGDKLGEGGGTVWLRKNFPPR